jgi:hypothetical protein
MQKLRCCDQGRHEAGPFRGKKNAAQKFIVKL